MAPQMHPCLKLLLNSQSPNSCVLQDGLYDMINTTDNDESLSLEFCTFDFGIRMLEEIIYIDFNETDPEEIISQKRDCALKKFQHYIIKNIEILLHGCDVSLITELSAEPYEKKHVSKMAFTVLSEQQIKLLKNVLKFNADVQFNMENIHHIRKLVNVTESTNTDEPNLESRVDYCLIFKYDNGKICTYGYADRKMVAEKFPLINLVGHMEWTFDIPPLLCVEEGDRKLSFKNWYDLPCNKRCVAQYKNGRIYLPCVGDDNKRMCDIIKAKTQDLFSEKEVKEISSYIREFREKAIKQKKGTSVVFLPSKLAEQETLRLCKFRRMYKLSGKFFEDEPDTLLKFSNIDGANFIDYETKEYVAFGVILDGVANIESELSKGARHASVLTYMNNLVSEKPIFALTFSEDGGAQVYFKSCEEQVERIM